MRDRPAEDADLPADICQGAVVVGLWSRPLPEVELMVARFGALLSEGKAEEVQRELDRLSVEEKTALVLVSRPETRETLLSLASRGAAGYSPAVVNRLPSEVLADLLAVDSEYLKFNVEILRAMSPARFGRVVQDTMEPVYYWEHRQKLSWEWLEAVAALDDVDHRGHLLGSVDPALIEEALSGSIDRFGLNDVVGGIDEFPVKRYQQLSESGLGGPPPSAYLEDEAVGTVLDALWEAAPELFKEVLRGAWERYGSTGEELDPEADETEP